MLLTRSLPPQFLLPAWSARQLAGFTQKQRRQKQQRASKSDDTKLIWGDKPTRLHSKTPRPQNPSALSLFDELFPEEKGRREEAAEGQDQFGRLPAFVLKKRVAAAELKSKEERRKREEEVKNPKPLAFDGLRAKADWSLSEEQAERSERTGASVLVLNSAMKTLEESDFFRMSPKGEHIEGWTGGILKVIPGRDNHTLRPLGHYFILFSNDAAAKSYLSHVFGLWKLVKERGKWEHSGIPGLPLPPGILDNGEDVKKLINSFTLVPAYNQLFLRMPQKPYMPAMQRLLNEGGPAALAARKTKAENMVLISSGNGTIDRMDMITAIKDDGKRRNLHWKLAGGDDELVQLEDNQTEVETLETSWGRRKTIRRSPARYVLSFRDRHEARRFVREWHKRPLYEKDHPRPGDQEPPVVNAEVLW